MPKVVDRVERRAELVEATWRLILKDGFAGITLRRVSEEVGLSNGAIRHFFTSKAELLDAAYALALERTMARATVTAEGLHGMDAFRAWCLEIMPIDDIGRDEARITVAFWENAVSQGDGPKGETGWAPLLRGFLQEARDLGQVTSAAKDEDILNLVWWMMKGLQVAVLLSPALASTDSQISALDSYLKSLGRPSHS